MRDKNWLASKSLSSIELICAIYEEGSVSKAAEVLGVSQPTASRILNEFRENLGDDLFIYTSNSMEPTSYCQSLYPFYKEAIEQLSAAGNLHRKLDDVYRTLKIRLDCVEYYAQVISPRLFDSVSEYIEELYIENNVIPNTEHSAERLVKDIKSRRTDFIITDNPALDDSLKRKKIIKDDWALIKPREFPLEDLPFLRTGYDTVDKTFSDYEAKGALTSFNALIEHVASGIGFSAVPQRLVSFETSIETSPLNCKPYQLYLYWRPEKSADKRADLFRKAILKECDSL